MSCIRPDAPNWRHEIENQSIDRCYLFAAHLLICSQSGTGLLSAAVQGYTHEMKKNYRWMWISFIVWFVICGGYIDFIVWIEELKRPGSSENLSLELLRSGLLAGIPAGFVGIGISALVRWIIRSGWFRSGGSAS